MKRLLLPLTVFIMAALVLVACAPNVGVVPNTGSTPTVSLAATDTPMMAQTNTVAPETPAAETGITPLPQTTTSPLLTGTPVAATALPVLTGTPGEVGITPIPQTTNSPLLTGTPSANIHELNPVIGNYVRMSKLMNSAVLGSNGNQVGTVAGLLLTNPNPDFNNNSASGSSATVPAPTPAPATSIPHVEYVMVSPQGDNTQVVLVPWLGFDFVNGTQNNGSVLLNIADSAFNNAPRFDLSGLNSGAVQLGNSVSQYWAGQNLAQPNNSTSGAATNVAANGALLVVPSNFNGVNVTDSKNAVIGPASDVLINPGTGELAYLVFNGGQLLGNNTYVVPFPVLQLGANGPQLNNIQLKVPTNVVSQSPFFTTVDQIPMDKGLSEKLNPYWKDFLPSQLK